MLPSLEVAKQKPFMIRSLPDRDESFACQQLSSLAPSITQVSQPVRVEHDRLPSKPALACNLSGFQDGPLGKFQGISGRLQIDCDDMHLQFVRVSQAL